MTEPTKTPLVTMEELLVSKPRADRRTGEALDLRRGSLPENHRSSRVS